MGKYGCIHMWSCHSHTWSCWTGVVVTRTRMQNITSDPHKRSWAPLIRTRLFRIPCYFKLKTISFGSALQSITMGYFKLPLFGIVFRFPWEFGIAAFNCTDLLTRSALIGKSTLSRLVYMEHKSVWKVDKIINKVDTLYALFLKYNDT